MLPDACHLLRSPGREALALIVDVLLPRKDLEARLPMLPQLSTPNSPTGAPFVTDLACRIDLDQLIVVDTDAVHSASSNGDPSCSRREKHLPLSCLNSVYLVVGLINCILQEEVYLREQPESDLTVC